jgi:excinuclease ABC subunit A
MKTKGSIIQILGAREHNLKNIDLDLPRNSFIVFTGLSGSGKSSLAFDTIFAEGQRRYIETFSSYARQFIGGLERPDVDQIKGLSPVISIEQKTVSKSPRSTVGTITELYDFYRLLFAKVSTAYSKNTGEIMIKYSDNELSKLIQENYSQKKIAVLSSKIRGRKGHYKELFVQIQKSGYTKVRIDGIIQDIVPGMRLDRYKIHDIEIVIDRFSVKDVDSKRILDAISSSFNIGDDIIMVYDYDNEEIKSYSRNLICPSTGVSYPDPEPNLFSFNSPYGACTTCNGLGITKEIEFEKVIPNQNMSIKSGGIKPLGESRNNWIFKEISDILKKGGISIDTPIKNIDQTTLTHILNGTANLIDQDMNAFEGVLPFLKRQSLDKSLRMQRWTDNYSTVKNCKTCKGTRLNESAGYFRIGNKNIAEISEMDMVELKEWTNQIDGNLNTNQIKIGSEIIKEIKTRLQFILDVGLDYLSLNRPSKSLSGGEAQRIRLANQIGTELINVLYILDEPSIGLHQRDNNKLIKSLKNLQKNGNSIIVVEHDREIMEAADLIVDIGPKAGINGGEIVSKGTFKELSKSNTITGQYLSRKLNINIPEKIRKGTGKYITLSGASGHNLKNINLKIPLGTFTCISGVSGSGKSSLINQTLVPVLFEKIYKSHTTPLPYSSLKGFENIDKIVEIDQKPIGRTPRSNPATYTKVFDEIRQLYASLPEAQIRGYKPGRFSFNVSGGKCETCNGGGMKLIEMNFLPDVYVECESCQGKRYNYETLQVKFRGKSISDILNMSISDALVFFENQPRIKRKISSLMDVGLGYVTLGQSSTTLSGGEAQRIKLASELSKKSTGKTLYILDEPSTGLHFEDINQLLSVLNKLVDEGNTVLVIEHNLDIIKIADHIIDMGPEGGGNGGDIVFKGTVKELVNSTNTVSYTAKYLKKEL